MSVAKRLRTTQRYVVDEVASGEEAIAAIRQISYDLVILDHQMGGVSGLNVLQWMHEEKMTVPVIMVTGTGTENIAVEVMKLGAYDYIPKESFDLSRLPALVNATLERHKFNLERKRTEKEAGVNAQSNIVPDHLRHASLYFSESAHAAFHVIENGLREYRQRIRPNIDPLFQSELDRIMRNAEEQLKMVSLLTAVLSDLAILAIDPSTPKPEKNPAPPNLPGIAGVPGKFEPPSLRKF